MTWDQIVSLVIVAAAALYLIRRRRNGASTCGHCRGCGAKPVVTELVQLRAQPRADRKRIARVRESGGAHSDGRMTKLLDGP